MDNLRMSKMASPEKIEQAKELLRVAGLTSPGLRMLAEMVINIGEESGIEEVIGLLTAFIEEKEAAYQEFRSKVKGITKEILIKNEG